MEAAITNAKNAGVAQVISFYNQDCTNVEQVKKVLREERGGGRGRGKEEVE